MSSRGWCWRTCGGPNGRRRRENCARTSSHVGVVCCPRLVVRVQRDPAASGGWRWPHQCGTSDVVALDYWQVDRASWPTSTPMICQMRARARARGEEVTDELHRIPRAEEAADARCRLRPATQPRPAAGLRDYQRIVVDRMLLSGPRMRLRGLRGRQDEDRIGVGSRRRRAHRPARAHPDAARRRPADARRRNRCHGHRHR